MSTSSSYDYYSSMEFYHNRAREMRAAATRDLFSALLNRSRRSAR